MDVERLVFNLWWLGSRRRSSCKTWPSWTFLNYFRFFLQVLVGGWKFLPFWLNAPDVSCVFDNCPIAGKLARCTNVHDDHVHPLWNILDINFITKKHLGNTQTATLSLGHLEQPISSSSSSSSSTSFNWRIYKYTPDETDATGV